MASTRRHTACRRTAEFASRTCCLPFYVHFQNGGSNAAQGSDQVQVDLYQIWVDSAKTAEPKMAFNFAHLLSAACGGAPHRLRRLRRPWRRAVVRARPSVWFSWGARLVSLDLYRISTLVAKLRNRKWRLILRTCCPPPAAALRAAWGACGAPLAGGSSVCTAAGAPGTQPALYGVLRGSTTTQSWLPHAREWLLYLRKHWASLVPHP